MAAALEAVPECRSSLELGWSARLEAWRHQLGADGHSWAAAWPLPMVLGARRGAHRFTGSTSRIANLAIQRHVRARVGERAHHACTPCVHTAVAGEGGKKAMRRHTHAHTHTDARTHAHARKGARRRGNEAAGSAKLY